MNIGNTRKFDVSATFTCLCALLFWSVGPVFIKFLTGYLDLWTQNLLRYSTASLFWLPFLIFSFKRKSVDSSIWRKALLPATANIAMQTLWAAAFYYIDPAFAVLLNKTSVIWVVVFCFIFFADERILLKSKPFWFGMMLSIIGVVGVLCYKEDFTASKNITGIAIALATAFCWGIYTVAVKRFFKDVDSRCGFSVMSIYTVAGFCVLTFFFGEPAACLKMSLWPWLCVIISGIACIGLGHVLYYASIRRIGATIPSLVLLSQPFFVFAISAVVFGESLNLFQFIFGFILLAGSAFAIWTQQYLK